MTNRLNIRRSQLASFLNNDADLIRRFEELIDDVGDSFPDLIESLQIGQALSDASRRSGMSDLIGAMNRLSTAIETMPAQVNNIEESNDLTPSSNMHLNNFNDLEPANQIIETV